MNSREVEKARLTIVIVVHSSATTLSIRVRAGLLGDRGAS